MTKFQEGLAYLFMASIILLMLAIFFIWLEGDNGQHFKTFEIIGYVATFIICVCVILMGFFPIKNNKS